MPARVIEYHLFRVKFVPSTQIDLFPDSVPGVRPATLFWRSLSEQPSIELRGLVRWHIGNLSRQGDSGGGFAVGKTTQTTVEKFDEATRKFIDEASDASPYTNLVFDLDLGLIAIAKKPKLASTGTVAKRLVELLSSTETVRQALIDVVVDPIYDPEGFLRKIAHARHVLRFKSWFTGPNPIDADELLQRPLAGYAKKVRASRGNVHVEGPSLDKDTLSEVARSTAALGNDASATILQHNGHRMAIQLRGDQVSIKYDVQEHEDSDIHSDMLQKYDEVRNGARAAD